MATSDLRTWAVKGAEQRLVEITEEARVIFRTFPELRRRGRGFDLPSGPTKTAGDTQVTAAARRRRKMSAAARKRISDAQKARWAKQRADSSSSNDNSRPRTTSRRKK